MKRHIKLFEEFCLNPEEAAIKKQFMTNPVTADVPVTRTVSQIVSDEHGMKVQVGQPAEPIIAVIEEPTKEPAKKPTKNKKTKK